MRLARLIADFQLAQARLEHSMARDGNIATRVALMRRSATLMDSIEAYDPIDAQEYYGKIDFFLTRAQRGKGQRDLSIALDLINHFGPQPEKPDPDRSLRGREVLGRLVARGADQNELVRYVAGLAERASLVDHTFRHMCTSKGNAAFHDRPANEFVNLHMCDLVGAQRYYARSEMQMNRSLKGNSLGYYYPLDVPVLGVRVMQCFMRPWHRTTGETGGLMVWIDDVTDKLSLTDPVGDSPVV